jgi:hypothetical protein
MADQLKAADATLTVADAMIPAPKISDREATVRDMKALFGNDKVHAVLIVHCGVLSAVVEWRRQSFLLAATNRGFGAPLTRGSTINRNRCQAQPQLSEAVGSFVSTP